MKLAINIASKACQVILLASNREVRAMFEKKDAKIFHKAAKRIERAHRTPKIAPFLKDLSQRVG